MLLITLVFILNLGISYWNARVTGLVWVETKQMGGMVRFMAWMGGIMAACGFTWCYLILLAIGAGHFGYLTPKYVELALSVGYVLIVPAIIFSGFFIWIDSLVTAWRRRDLPSVGIATWNTFAQGYNTYQAVQGFGPAFGKVTDGIKDAMGDSDDPKAGLAMLAIILALVALAGGVLTTMAIVKHYAGSRPLPEHPQGRQYA